MIKVIVCDDHPIFREGVKRIIGQCRDIAVTDEVGDGAALKEKLKECDCDVIVLDITLAGDDGLDILKDLREARCTTPVLILSMHPEGQYAERTLRAGAQGYVEKESMPEELLDAIRRVTRGRKYVSPALAEQLASELGGFSQKPLHESLSDREFQILRMIASGRRVKAIAADLSLSPSTVDTYRARILSKLKLADNTGLVRYTIETKLL